MHPSVQLLGHGGMGMGKNYPLNTMESYLGALHLGADGIEMDVQLTKDGVLVGFHDETLDKRTTLKGRIHEYTYDELQETYYKNFPLTTYGICKIDDFFAQLENPQDYLFNFDCKLFVVPYCDTYFVKYKKAIEELVEKYQLYDNLMIEAPNPEFLIVMKETGLFLVHYAHDFETGFQEAVDLGFDGLILSTHNLTTEQVAKAQQKGLKVIAWEMYSRKEFVETLNKGVDVIIADNIQKGLRY